MSVPVIIGAGLAGLATALSLAPRQVIVLGWKSMTAMTSSELAQGGIAAAVGSDDAPSFHEVDTLAAGAGLCDPAIVRMVTSMGPQAIERLAIWGVPFDRDDKQVLLRGLEGAHGRRRIVHADGDATGRAVMKAVIERVRATPSITLIEDSEALEIVANDHGVLGVVFRQVGQAQPSFISSQHVIVATGSACALWRHATVPLRSWGHGLLLAARAGAKLRDLEFVQFHPTGLNCGLDPMPLITEALRGDGAKLVNNLGQSFVGELSPRDIVARAIWQEITQERKVFLDARKLKNLRSRFGRIFDYCLKSGINPAEQPIPIWPVSHYHMGGIATDDKGRTSVPGLFACGECACTGLHGANRLASNSLLEDVVMGVRIGDHLRPLLPRESKVTQTPFKDDPGFSVQETPETIAKVRNLMEAHVGLQRSAHGLGRAILMLEDLAPKSPRALLGLMIAKAALARRESRGAHSRTDFPKTEETQAKSRLVWLDGNTIQLGD